MADERLTKALADYETASAEYERVLITDDAAARPAAEAGMRHAASAVNDALTTPGRPSFLSLLATPTEQFDPNGEVVAMLAAYRSPTSATASASPPAGASTEGSREP